MLFTLLLRKPHQARAHRPRRPRRHQLVHTSPSALFFLCLWGLRGGVCLLWPCVGCGLVRESVLKRLVKGESTCVCDGLRACLFCSLVCAVCVPPGPSRSIVSSPWIPLTGDHPSSPLMFLLLYPPKNPQESKYRNTEETERRSERRRRRQAGLLIQPPTHPNTADKGTHLTGCVGRVPRQLMRLDGPCRMSQFLPHAVRNVEHVAQGGAMPTTRVHPNSPPEPPD